MQVKSIFISLIFTILSIFNQAIASLDLEHNVKMINYSKENYIILQINIPKDEKIYLFSKEKQIDFTLEIEGKFKNKYNILWPKFSSDGNDLYYKDNIIIAAKINDKDDIIDINYQFVNCGKICKLIKHSEKIEVSKRKFEDSSDIISESLNEYFDSKSLYVSDKYIQDNNLNIEIITESKLKNPVIAIKSIYDLEDPIIESMIDGYRLVFEKFSNRNKDNIEFMMINKDDYLVENMIIENKDIMGINIIIIALLGGLILNFMPCVLPVLSIKLLNLVTNIQNQKISKINLLYTICGIIFSFVIIALAAIILKYTGNVIGFGIYMQNPYFIILICILLVFLISNSNENIIINIDNKIYDKLATGQNNQKKSNFIDGIISVLLATPCSTPLVGSAVAFALTQNYFSIIIIFILISLGFAFPYFMVLLIPDSIKLMPKSGKWMSLLKKFISILLIISLLWYLYIYTTQTSVIAGILLFLICLLIKFALEQKHKLKKYIIVSIILSAFIIPISTKEKFDNFDNITNQIWHNFEPQKIPELIKLNKIIIIDISASWCPACKINKLMVFDKPKILKILYDKNIIAMRGDLTKPNDHIMKFVNEHNRYGIPFNMIYSAKFPNGIILSENLSEDELINNLIKAGYKIN